MTAIIGLVDDDGTIYMGGDSAATYDDGDQILVTSSQKVFRPKCCPWFVIGCAGEVRFAQLLQHAFPGPLPPPKESDMLSFMVTDFIASIRKTFDAFEITARESGVPSGHSFLVGYQGHIFRIEPNFGVIDTTTGYLALGSGESLARGALYATQGLMKAEDRVLTALNAASEYHSTVRPPFIIETLPMDQDWYQDVRKPKRRKRKKAK